MESFLKSDISNVSHPNINFEPFYYHDYTVLFKLHFLEILKFRYDIIAVQRRLPVLFASASVTLFVFIVLQVIPCIEEHSDSIFQKFNTN